MMKLLLITFLSLLIQSCQGPGQVTPSNQIGGVNFPGSTLTVVPPADGWRKLADNIDITVMYPSPITVSGNPYIEVSIGSNIRKFYYFSGSGTTNIVFRYTVTSTDLDTDGITIDDKIILSGGTLTYQLNFFDTANLPTDFIIPDYQIYVDGVAPTLTASSAPAGGNYSTGQLLKYQFTFSENVIVSGQPYVNVGLSSATVAAGYSNGSGTKVLEFARNIQLSDSDLNGFVSSTSLNLNTVNGVHITDLAGNHFSGTVPSLTSSNVLINVTQPRVTWVSATTPLPGSYTVGQNLDFVLTMSASVNVTGTPSLNLILNTGIVSANYFSGSGSSTLTFRYTVQSNHVDPDGLILQQMIMLNNGTIKNLTGTENASLVIIPSAIPTVLKDPTLLTLANRIRIDAATGPYVTYVLTSPAGTYLENQTINFTLNFNAPVTVTNNPYLPVIVGSSTVSAGYVSGSGTSSLVFSYTPTTSHQDMDGITLSGPIQFNPGDSISLTADPSKVALSGYYPPDTSGIKVDGTSPSIQSITTPTVGPLVAGEHIYFNVKFSESVNIQGAPILNHDLGSAIYLSGDGTDTLLFRYTIQANDTDTNGITVTSLTLPGGATIRDPRLHNADLTLTPVTFNSVSVDAVAPQITGINIPASQYYKIGDQLIFTYTWDENVNISGIPKIALLLGTNLVYATYDSFLTSLSGANTTVFKYTVLAGDIALTGITSTGIVSGVGSIKDSSGNPADLTTVISPNMSGIWVDGVIPFVSNLAVPSNGLYGIGDFLNFTVTWSEKVNLLNGLNSLSLTIGSTVVNAVLNTINPTQTVHTFSYQIVSGQLDSNGISMLTKIFLASLVTLKDDAGNNANLHINSVPLLTGITVDGVAPTILSITKPADGTYLYNQNIDFSIQWSEAVTVTGTQLKLQIGNLTRYATYQPSLSTSTNSVYRYTVELNISDSNGISIAPSEIELSGGSIQDAAGNDAIRTFSTPNLSLVIVDGIKAMVDPLGQVATYTQSGATPFGIGSTISVDLKWTKDVSVSGSPTIKLRIGSSLVNATYVSNPSSSVTRFSYQVNEVDALMDVNNSGIEIVGPINLNGGSIIYLLGFPVQSYNAHLAFNEENLPLINVDGIRPYVVSISSTNVSNLALPSIVKSGEILRYTLTFNENITLLGSVQLDITIDGTLDPATNDLASCNTTANPKVLHCDFPVPAGDRRLDLDGVSISSTLVNGFGDFIFDQAFNLYNWSVPALSEKDYVYLSNMIARYNFNTSNYNTVSCFGTLNCITSVTDLTGNNNTLTSSDTSLGPLLFGMFGPNSSPTVYNWSLPTMPIDSSRLVMTTDMDIKYMFVAMKTVADGSTTASMSNHPLLTRKSTTGSIVNWTPSIQFTSTSSLTNIEFSPDMSFMKNAFTMYPFATDTYNGTSADPAYLPTLGDIDYWDPGTDYIYSFELQNTTTFDSGSFFGGTEFHSGFFAEIILLDDSTTLTAAQINMVRDELERLHNVY